MCALGGHGGHLFGNSLRDETNIQRYGLLDHRSTMPNCFGVGTVGRLSRLLVVFTLLSQDAGHWWYQLEVTVHSSGAVDVVEVPESTAIVGCVEHGECGERGGVGEAHARPCW